MADLLTIPETADYLRVSTRQVRRYIHDGRLRVIRIGYRTVLIRRREVDVFLKVVENWTRSKWFVESAFTTRMNKP